MTRLHRMNLKGPWDYEWLDGPHSVPDSDPPPAEASEFLLSHSRVRMPSSMEDAWGSVTGRIRFQRRFQKPTNLEPHERVHIAFDGLGGTAAVTLNSEPLARLCDVDSTQTFDVTDKLGQSNILRVELTWAPAECHQSQGGLWGAIAVEIHDATDGS